MFVAVAVGVAVGVWLGVAVGVLVGGTGATAKLMLAWSEVDVAAVTVVAP